MKKTKIICSIGPASCSPDVMEKMVLAGMNVARINFSHATLEERKTDEELVKTILQNILEVILKSVDMGEISLSLKVPTNEYIESKNLPLGEYVLFSVSSNSLLLSENDLESMFDPYKIIDTTNRKNLLRAITLACVKNIVQQLQGVVWVESKILKNTSFNVIIPSNN